MEPNPRETSSPTPYASPRSLRSLSLGANCLKSLPDLAQVSLLHLGLACNEVDDASLPTLLSCLPAGLVSRRLVAHVDWWPTLVRRAGGRLSQPLPLDGVDQWAAIIAPVAPAARTELLHNVDISTKPVEGFRGALRGDGEAADAEWARLAV